MTEESAKMEFQLTTKSGLLAAVIQHNWNIPIEILDRFEKDFNEFLYSNFNFSNEYRCGYVGIPYEFYISFFPFNRDFIEVHGGITFTGKHYLLDEHIKNENLIWIGFDTMHGCESDYQRSLQYCIDQCEHLADQLKKIIDSEFIE
ncbi:MAG: hypothetical protein ACOCQD_00930 [archaeon]